MSRGVFAHWPNRITALRFLGAIALFAVLGTYCDVPREEVGTSRTAFTVAFWLFLATAVSDVLDGYLARKGNLITAFGRIADPFVDKVLILGSMIYLAVLPWSSHWFPAWIIVVILAREFLITSLRGYVESIGAAMPADWFGKVKMATQCLAVAFVLAIQCFELSTEARGFWEALAEVSIHATWITSLGSGLAYIYKTRQILSESGA